MKKIEIGKDVYPVIDNLRELEDILRKRGIKISFLPFSGTVEFEIREDLDQVENCNADLCIIECKSRTVVLMVYIGIGEMVFLDGFDNIIYQIQILENYDN